MAFDYTNLLETASQANNGDFLFYDRAGNVGDVAAANVAGEWCEENGSTISAGTGASANPSGRAGFIYTEASTPAASTVWRMQRDTTFDTFAIGLVINLRYSKSIENASEFYMEFATLASPNETTDWTILETITGTLGTDTWIDDVFDFSGETQSTTFRVRLRCNLTNAFTNDLCISTWNEVGTDLEGIASVDSSKYGALSNELDFDDTNVDVNGLNFLSTQGSGQVWISDASTLAGSANEVEIDGAIDTWSDTEIGLDFSGMTQTEVDNLHTLGPGTSRWIIATNNDSDEYSLQITLHRPEAFEMVAGLLVPGVTTSRITGMSGTFGGGRAEEAAAQNPSTTLTDVADDGRREDLFSIQAKPNSVDGDTYDFRFRYGGVLAETVTQTPQVTVSAATGETATGAPSITNVTASGTAEVINTATGAPSITAVTSAGTAEVEKLATGSPSITPITSAGTAELEHTATGSPSISVITASGTAELEHLATGAPQLTAITSAGTAELEHTATGSPSITAITASGSVPLLGRKATGAPSITAITSDGMADNCDKIAPDTIAAITNLSGAVTDIDDSPAAPDALWLLMSPP